MTTDEEGQLSPRSANAKDPAVLSSPPSSPRALASPTSAPGPPSLQPPLPASGSEHECVVSISPSKKTNKMAEGEDPSDDDSPNKKIKRKAEVQDPVSPNNKKAVSACSTPGEDLFLMGEDDLFFEGEDDLFFEGEGDDSLFLMGEEALPSNGADEGKESLKKQRPNRKENKDGPESGSMKKERRNRKKNKDEQQKVPEPLDPDSPTEVKLPPWDGPLSNPSDQLYQYLVMILQKRPHEDADLRIDFFQLLLKDPRIACAVCNADVKTREQWVGSALRNLNLKNRQPKDVEFVGMPDWLMEDLGTVTEADIISGWIFDYLIYHPFFSSSVGRRHFIQEVFLVTKSFKFLAGSFWNAILEEEPGDFWLEFARANDILSRTLYYRKNLMKKPTVHIQPHEVTIETAQGDTLTLSRPARVIVQHLAVQTVDTLEQLGAAGNEVAAAGSEAIVGDEADATSKQLKVVVGGELSVGGAVRDELPAVGDDVRVGSPGGGEVNAEDDVAGGVGAPVGGAVGNELPAEGDDVAIGVGAPGGGKVTAEDNEVLSVDDPELLNANTFQNLVPDLTKGVAMTTSSVEKGKGSRKRSLKKEQES
nr:unnamed protein product [Digitaria exilis]